MSELQELSEELDFEQWLDSEGITYRRGSVSSRGRELNIKECPHCGSAGWKLYFNVTTGLGKCFAGDHPEDVQFNKLTFMKSHLGCNWTQLKQAIKDELRQQGWKPKTTEEETLESKRELVSDLTLPFHYMLPIEGQLPTYLVERNVGVDLTTYFDLRYCVNGQHVYLDYVTKKPKMQCFDMRILIPVYSLDGEMKTFQGRDVTGVAEKRYLFPNGLPASGKFLYNGHNAIGKKTVVVCEGVFDVIGAKRALATEMSIRELVEPVGTFGMHLSGNVRGEDEDQLGAFLELKKQGLETVVMMWDSEKQAIHNTFGAARRLISIGLKVRIACLGEEGLDPGSATNEQIIRAFYRAKQYTKALEMMAMLKGIEALK